MDISQNETDLPGNPTSYAITRLTELKTAQNGERVRVLGNLVSFDPTTMLATIEMDGQHYPVYTALLELGNLKAGYLYQWMGEVRRNFEFPAEEALQNAPFLRCYLHREVNDLDVRMFETVHDIKKRFLETAGAKLV